jgi:hypothetical protein
MRNSKCAILSILISAFLLSDISGQIPGVVAGWNSSSMILIDQEDTRFSYDSKMGFNAGATLEIPVIDFLSAETGILLVKRGRVINSTENFEGIDLIRRENHELYYLDFPLVARLRFNAGKFDVFASGGPYFSYGLSGKIMSRQVFGDQTENETRPIRWGTTAGTNDYKRTDYGFIFSTGIERGAFNAGISYAAGESDISPDTDQGSVLENRHISIVIGYKFGKAVKARSKKSYVVPEKVKPDMNMTRIQAINPYKADEESFCFEKLRATSLAAMRAESEQLGIENWEKADSIAALRIIQLEEKANTDSIAKATEYKSTMKQADDVIYRVQFASSINPKGSYEIEVAGKSYKTWEYFYAGAHRSTAGEFTTLTPAVALQHEVRKTGYPQAFVVAFKNGIRTNDPSLFK